ncbi:MAG: toprim domain-containing protein [Oscillospiraceae bacterium]
MKRIREVIVCEGRYDQNALKQVVDATVLTTGGFQIFKDAERLALIRRLAEGRGVILLLDSDGAGFVIRNHLKGALPKELIKQAYIPDIPGKEKRKKTPGKEGKLGVEGMEPEVLLQALRRAGATFLDEPEEPCERAAVTKADMLEKGLVGPGSVERRRALLEKLQLPAHMSANALLEALNLLMTREEFMEL